MSVPSGHAPVVPVEGTFPVLSPERNVISQDTNVQPPAVTGRHDQESLSVDALGVAGTTDPICGTADGTIRATSALALLTGLVKTLSTQARWTEKAYLWPDVAPVAGSVTVNPVAVQVLVAALVRSLHP